MPTEFKFKKHTKVVVDLEVGDKVRTAGWGAKLDGRDHEIVDIKAQFGCESGVMVKINNYDGWLDSNWLDKLPTNNKN